MVAASHRDAVFDLLDFAHGLRWEDLPWDIRQRAIMHVIDGFGAIISGSGMSITRKVQEEVDGWGAATRVHVPALNIWASVPGAALLLGTMARALDFDDVHEGAFVHPSASAIPTAVIMAQLPHRVTGPQFLTAIVVGMEWCARLGLSPRSSPHESGMSQTFQLGLLAATVSGGLVMGLRHERLHNACGLAYGALSGNLAALSEGDISIPVQHGLMTMNAATAVRLAGRDISGPRDLLEGRYGYFNVFHRGAYDRSTIIDDLGSHFTFVDTSIKAFPAAKPLHPAIVAALGLRHDLAIPSDNLRRVSIGVNAFAKEVAGTPLEAKQRPATAPQMQFSLPWAFAVSYATGKAGPAQFSTDALSSREAVALAQRVDVHVDSSLEAEHNRAIGPVTVAVETDDGRVFRRTATDVPGQPASPMSDDELQAKFVTCCTYTGIGADRGRAAFADLRALEECDDVGQWLQTVIDDAVLVDAAAPANVRLSRVRR